MGYIKNFERETRNACYDVLKASIALGTFYVTCQLAKKVKLIKNTPSLSEMAGALTAIVSTCVARSVFGGFLDDVERDKPVYDISLRSGSFSFAILIFKALAERYGENA